MATDRRRAPRFRIDQMIEMSFGREQALRCRGVDLSEVGLLCRTDVALDPGTRVFLLLSLSAGGDDEPVSCEGVVVRCESVDSGFEAGVSFTEVGAAVRTRLAEYLSHRPRA